MTHEQVEQIAQDAAQLYGQQWAGLPQWSKDLWREMVRDDSGQVYSEASRCACAAKKAHLEKQATPEEAKPVEKKTKKRGNE